MQNVDTTKYVIHAEISADGIVERPDVVGAIFGQTEGLLGSDLDLRDLQKTGRIGRIDVQIASSGGKSSGSISIPSSFDKVETAILASALETIDRVGPCIARIKISNIEDVRASKRRYVVERAKQIIMEMFDENILDTQGITEQIKQSVRVERSPTSGRIGSLQAPTSSTPTPSWWWRGGPTSSTSSGTGSRTPSPSAGRTSPPPSPSSAARRW
jgi:hypothetical protein